MRLTFLHKIFLSLLILSSVIIGVMYLYLRHSVEQGFTDFFTQRKVQRIVQMSERLALVYQQDRSWDRFKQNPRLLIQILRQRQPWSGDSRIPGLPPPSHAERDHRAPPFPFQVTLLDDQKTRIAGRTRITDGANLRPIELDGRTIGYLAVSKEPYREQIDIRLEQGLRNALLTVAVIALALSLVLAWPLAYGLLRPLRRIAETSRELARGNYQVRLAVTSQDEIGRLSLDVNDLAQALEKAEQSRRQWVADISHELRTPISVLRGEVEALQDGVIEYSPEALASIHAEIMRLNRLVDELYQLSLSDVAALHYRKDLLDPVTLLNQVSESFRHTFESNGIALHIDNSVAGSVRLNGDKDRLTQLFTNLLTNSLKYTSPSGQLRIQLHRQENTLTVDIEDSAPSVPADSLPHLFERFFRVESSRNRETGGAGLGLALCKNIVEAHEGRIEASASGLGGLHIHIELPLIR